MRTVRLLYSHMLSPASAGERGEQRTLTDAEAADLVTQGIAVYDDEPREVTEAAEAAELEITRERQEDERDRLEAVAEGLEAPQEDLTPAGPPEMPKPYAPKSSWVAYALAAHPELTEDAAEAMTKNELMHDYGERL